MDKSGFTLVEIIGVIIILAIIVLIAFPSILGAMNKTETQMDEATETLLIANAKNYFSDNVVMIDNTSYCVSVKTLISQNYTKTPISTVDKTKSEDIEKNYYVKAAPDGKQKINGVYVYKWKYTLTKSPGMTCD